MHIFLRPYQPSFLETAYAWRNEEITRRFNPLGTASREATASFFEREGSSFAEIYEHSNQRWFVEANGALVGTISLQNISPMMGVAEIGYMFGEKFHGRGIATAALTYFLDRLFAHTPLRRVFALVHEENKASRRVLDKLGFEQEGVLRNHYLVQGIPTNEVAYGLLREEWID
jgi:ribosomal-protein-alanine N-acetyltransferase